MKKMRVLFTSLALFALGLVGCNKNPGNRGNDLSRNNKLVESVELSTDYEHCDIGDSFQIEAVIHFRDDHSTVYCNASLLKRSPPQASHTVSILSMKAISEMMTPLPPQTGQAPLPLKVK